MRSRFPFIPALLLLLFVTACMGPQEEPGPRPVFPPVVVDEDPPTAPPSLEEIVVLAGDAAIDQALGQAVVPAIQEAQGWVFDNTQNAELAALLGAVATAAAGAWAAKGRKKLREI